MDNDELQQYLILAGENFYTHIEEKYGENVRKILEYHDIDTYLILGATNERELIDVFEKTGDLNSSLDLEFNKLKKEICNTFDGKTSLKFGTKNKLNSLLKTGHDAVKLKKFQTMSQARLNRLDKRRSTSSSNNVNTIDSELSPTEHITLVNESISKLLTTIKYNIHGC